MLFFFGHSLWEINAPVTAKMHISLQIHTLFALFYSFLDSGSDSPAVFPFRVRRYSLCSLPCRTVFRKNNTGQNRRSTRQLCPVYICISAIPQTFQRQALHSVLHP